jgi:hypothetical protein
MKKIATYYFLGLALLNVLCGNLLVACSKMMSDQFHEFLEGRSLPGLTLFVLSHPHWPFIIVALSLAGTAVAFATSARSSTLCHLVIALLVADTFMLMTTIIGYCLPYSSGTTKLGQ